MNYYSSSEIQARYGLSPGAITVLALRYGWGVEKHGRRNLYSAADVDAYALASERTRLLNEIGLGSRALVWHGSFDEPCSVCGAFAVRLPPQDVAVYIQQAAEGRQDEWPWRCAGGHP